MPLYHDTLVRRLKLICCTTMSDLSCTKGKVDFPMPNNLLDPAGWWHVD
jgi:hypothetical protein